MLHLEGDPVSLCHALGLHDTKELDIHEFVMGCLSLRGGAKSVDMAALMKENKRVLKRIQRMIKVTHERLNRLDVLLSPTFLQHKVSSVTPISLPFVNSDFEI